MNRFDLRQSFSVFLSGLYVDFQTFFKAKETSLVKTSGHDAHGNEFSKRPSDWAARLVSALQFPSLSNSVWD
jgi:hypothetical protein